MSHRSFEEYAFELEPDSELRALIQEYDDIINDSNPLSDVMNTWTLEKPAGLIEILPPGEVYEERYGIPEGFDESDYTSPEKLGAFLYEFEKWFYYQFDGYLLYFSRFPTLPPALSRTRDAALEGILLGYPPTDVAQYNLEVGQKKGRFKTESGWDT